MKKVLLLLIILSTIIVSKAQSTSKLLPVLPLLEATRLMDSCTAVDYTYYTPSFSMSMEDKNTIQQTIHLLTGRAFLPKENTKPTARVFFQIKGNIVHQADFYYYPDESIGGFIFYQNNQKTYSSLMHPDGKNYFDSIFAEMKKGK